MNLYLNWVDYIIIASLAFFVFGSVGRPLLWEFFDLVSFILAGILSFSFYNIPAGFLETEFRIPHGLSLVLGFMAVWFFSELIFFLLIRLFLEKFSKINIPYSRYLGVFPALFRGLIFIAIALVTVATFPVQPSIKKAVLDSEIGSRILNNAYALEAPVKRVFGGVANDSLSFLTIKPKTSEKINLGFQTNNFTIDPDAETGMLRMVNSARELLGLSTLALDERLRDASRGHSADMLRRGYFSHFSPEGKTVADRALDAGADFIVAGENLAYAPTAESAFKGFMNSEGHRNNILSQDFGRIGIGVMDTGVYGKMFTQVFADGIQEAGVSGIEGERVYVERVVDGDTLILSGGKTVRFIGIDTPETVDPRRPVGCFGKEASNEVKALLTGNEIIIQKDISDKDKYDRLLRLIFLPLEDGKMLFVNDYLIRAGFAKVMTYPPDVKYNARFREAESEAKEGRRGLWGKCR